MLRARLTPFSQLRWENTCETRYTKIDDTSPAQLQKLTEELIMVNPEITAEHLLMHFKTFFPKLTTPTKQQLNQWLKSIRGNEMQSASTTFAFAGKNYKQHEE